MRYNCCSMLRNRIFLIILQFVITPVTMASQELCIAAARSFVDSRLLEHLNQQFSAKYPAIRLSLKPMGSLQAIEELKQGKCDVSFSHASVEEALLHEQGYALYRTQVVHSEYALFGPPDSLLGLHHSISLIPLLKQLQENNLYFISPAKHGGTYKKIQSLWSITGITPNWPEHQQTELSPIETLHLAAEFGGYTISDMGVYLRHREEFTDRLVPLYRGDYLLRNTYSIMIGNPAKNPQLNFKTAKLYYDYIVSYEGQNAILDFSRQQSNVDYLSPAAHLDSELISMQLAQQLESENRNLRNILILLTVLIFSLLITGWLALRIRKQKLHSIEQQNQLQVQLQQTQRLEALGNLAGGIAHDFNNILATILGYSTLILANNQYCNNRTLENYLKHIVTSAERARDLIQSMLIFSRGSRSQLHPLYIQSVASDTVSMLRPVIPSTIVLNLRMDENTPAILGSEVQLQQIITNLVINARDALADQGNIDINIGYSSFKKTSCNSCHGEIEGEYVEIRVSDNGPGIDTKHLINIFTPFFTTKPIGKGSGMGLSIVHGIVHEYHGHILVHSQIHQGTRISILLPVSGKQPEAAQGSNTDTEHHLSASADFRILVVDDEQPVADVVSTMLSAMGYSVVTFTDGIEALNEFRKNHDHYQMVITDQTMPGITGDLLTREIRMLDSEIPVIIMSGYNNIAAKNSFRTSDSIAYLEKPFDLKKLKQVISIFQSQPA